MNIDKVAIAGVAVVVIAGLFVSPAQAHRKYRPHWPDPQKLYHCGLEGIR